ncbi:MAG: class I SAM-dependent methyltransferase [Alphaproteobacteria bacterium]|nr:methyltransferase domain-containing protein [Alphaproteobacteria bacterium]MDE2109517.1 class I SAM-dependent methyltransferase [Alphaproteobacteria bacterium]
MNVVAAEPIIAWQKHEGRRVARVKGHDVILCENCGFRHVLPVPDEAQLEPAYRDLYYSEAKPSFLAHAGEDQDWAALGQTDRLESFEKQLGQGRRRLLDIGSGPGFFLHTAQARGWEVLGVEPSRQAAAHARSLGVEVVEGFFNAETAAGLCEFDAVHMNNVLEHVPDPAALIALARDRLSPGGLICIGVPNDFSPFQIAGRASTGAGEWWVVPHHHLNYFDFATAAALLERLGFRVAERTTSFPMEAFLMMGEDYTGDGELGRACHKKRKRFDLALEATGLRETRRAFYRALADVGLGREAVVIAVKP